MTSSVLFTPVGINRMTLKNRIVMPAMASYHAAVNGEATEKLIRYHEERAKGGVGMNIVEATYVARSGNSFDLGLGISDDFMIKGLSKLTDAVHRHDGKIAIQLQHGGRFGNPPTSGCPRLLVSMIPGLAPTENARVMDADDIEGMVEAYVQAALEEMNVGILHVERADMDKLEFTLTVAEDLDCSGLPDLGHVVCTYDEGFISGLFKSFTGKSFEAKEVDCWCTGDRTCRFEVKPATE